MLILAWDILASLSTWPMKTSQPKSSRIHAPENIQVSSATGSTEHTEKKYV